MNSKERLHIWKEKQDLDLICNKIYLSTLQNKDTKPIYVYQNYAYLLYIPWIRPQ